jgi:hypothetical protein
LENLADLIENSNGVRVTKRNWKLEISLIESFWTLGGTFKMHESSGGFCEISSVNIILKL